MPTRRSDSVATPAPRYPAGMARTPARPGTWPLLVLVAWTLYVWGTRIVNALGDATLSSGGRAFSVGLALTFVALAAAGTVIATRSWTRPRTPGEVRVLRGFAAWTVVVWAVRVPMILADAHVIGFKVVHALLGVISVALAVWVWRTAAAGSARAEESLQPSAHG
jgi:hypothetical protein